MKLLALLLALFLTVQPEDAPPVNYSQTQEICCEDTDVVEEEAILRTFRVEQEQTQTSPFIVSPTEAATRRLPVGIISTSNRFERQWLTLCTLRL